MQRKFTVKSEIKMEKKRSWKLLGVQWKLAASGKSQGHGKDRSRLKVKISLLF